MIYNQHPVFRGLTTSIWPIDAVIIASLGYAMFVALPSAMMVLGIFAVYANATPIWLQYLQ